MNCDSIQFIFLLFISLTDRAEREREREREREIIDHRGDRLYDWVFGCLFQFTGELSRLLRLCPSRFVLGSLSSTSQHFSRSFPITLSLSLSLSLSFSLSTVVSIICGRWLCLALIVRLGGGFVSGQQPRHLQSFCFVIVLCVCVCVCVCVFKNSWISIHSIAIVRLRYKKKTLEVKLLLEATISTGRKLEGAGLEDSLCMIRVDLFLFNYLKFSFDQLWMPIKSEWFMLLIGMNQSQIRARSRDPIPTIAYTPLFSLNRTNRLK